MKIFLSAVSGQFKACRDELASDLRAIGCEVMVQEDFQQHGRTLLEKLQAYIEQCERVIAIVGDAYGFELDEAARQPQWPRRSYTQWEYFFALGERLDGRREPRKDIFLYFASPGFLAERPVAQSEEAARLQRDFVQSIRQSDEDRGTFDSADQLCRRVLRDGWQMNQRPQRKPVHLPFPSIGTLFKGREDFLRELRASLLRAGDGRAAAITGKAIHGLGGVGKTRAAVEYAWQHADDCSAVLFVPADSPENLRRNLAELAGPLVLDLQEQKATEEEVRLAAVLRWLHEHPGWFLILDNVDDEPAAQAAEELLARLHGGQVLITSRLARWSGCVEPLELDVLDEEDAARFLLERTASRRCKQESDEADAAQLAAELDGLALALEQAGAYINQMRITLAEYSKRWRARQPAVHQWHDQRQMKYPRSVAVTWQTTLDQLDDDEQALLNVLAWFDAEPIPLFVFANPSALSASLRFTKGEGNAENAKDAEAGREDWDEKTLREALANLADFSMIRLEVEAETVSVHRVVQEILRTRQDEPQVFLATALELLNAATPTEPDDVRTWPILDPLRPHLLKVIEYADAAGIPRPTTHLQNVLGLFLKAKALYPEAEQLFRRALAIDERYCGAHHPDVARDLDNLADLLESTNRRAEAEPLVRRALAIDEQSYGPDHPNVAVRLNNLGWLLKESNRIAEAEPVLRRALDIDERSFGPNHPNVARKLNRLAVLLKITDRLEEAEMLYRRALSIDEQFYGGDHPEVAIDLNNYALLLLETNRLSEAEAMVRRALAIDEEYFGVQHPKVALRLNNLAAILRDMKRPAQAESLVRRALVVAEQFFGEHHIRVASVLRNLGELLKVTGRLGDAEPVIRRALGIYEHSYGADHSEVAEELNSLAQVLQATNRVTEAEPLARRALRIFRKFRAATGHEHPHMPAARRNYRALLTAMNLPEDEIKQRLRETTP